MATKMFFSNDQGQVAQLIGDSRGISFAKFTGSSRSARCLTRRYMPGDTETSTFLDRMNEFAGQLMAKGWRRSEG